MSDSVKPVSSPIGTGGGGTFFEQHVGAFFIALLLTKGIPPLLKDCQVEEVHLQAEHLGWNTDDVLIVGNAGGERRRKLVSQVKRNFQISNNNEVCRKAFADFWNDFNDKSRFNPESDRLALIVLRGTNVLLDKFGSLLDCAKASINGSDFNRRLGIEGLLSKQARKQAADIQTILNETAEQPISGDEFWQFLCILHIISLDLHTQTAQQEALIKSLLALTSDDIDPIAAATATWGELLQLVGGSDGMPAAGSYYYEKLPQELRQRHSAVCSRPRGQLGQLIEHSSVTLDGINTTIAGSISIKREALEAQIFEAIESTQVSIVSGAAGQGKSAVAKSVIESISNDHFCLAFRAGEFDVSHIDQALAAIQDTLTADRLLSLLSAQNRVIVLIESVDRLLEASNRKAFTDLLILARKNKSIRLLLTCRDYCVDTVRMSLLEPLGIQHQVLNVNSFEDSELEQVASKIPGIALAIQNPNLRKLLRSPFLLNIAARIKWSTGEELPDSEKEFRSRCWRDVVRSEANAANGMPRSREKAFVQLSLRRAQKLRPYVPYDDLDFRTIEALRKDNLLSPSKDDLPFAAPAHDVFEDWAIMHWLDSQFAFHEWDATAISEKISGYPALRRSYRKWLSEALVYDTERADEFILSVTNEKLLPNYFRDDTIVCVLLSSSAEEFLIRNHHSLVRADHRLLLRIVFLLRVACKEAPSLLANERGLISQLLVPVGLAWTSVLKIVSSEIENLIPNYLGTILGLIEDWAQKVSYQDPKPPGYKAAGLVITTILSNLGGYDSKDLRRRTLDVFIKIPGSAPDFFKELIQRSSKDDYRDTVALDFRKLLLTRHSCTFACRDFPEEMKDLTKSFFFLSDESREDIRKKTNEYGWSMDVGPHFGIQPHVNNDFSTTASALRGPFWALLMNHPHHGIDFIISLMNHACSWYGEQKWPAKPLESAWQIELIIPGDKTPITQWANERLYKMYRGTSVAPHVLESALMALERWLLEIASNEAVDIESWLLKLLRESNNVAVTAVVASVCFANIKRCGSAGLALLSSADIFMLDRDRVVHEHTAGLLPSIHLEYKLYEEERSQSNALPHRKSDMESFAINLQLTNNRESVWKIIDEHRANLPFIEEQSKTDKLWRLALHRIDLRGIEVVQDPSPTKSENESNNSKEEEEYITLVPKEMEPDLQEIVNQGTRHNGQLKGLSLWTWGHSVFRGETKTNFKALQAKLSLAKDISFKSQAPGEEAYNLFGLSRDGSGFVAPIGIRDFWNDMEHGDRNWCIEKLIQEINKNSDSNDRTLIVSIGSMNPDGFSAYALPRVIQEVGLDIVDKNVTTAVVTAITHSVLEVRRYAAEGVGTYLGNTEPVFVVRCAAALAKQACLIEERIELEASKPYKERIDGHEIVQATAKKVRQSILSGNVIEEEEMNRLTVHTWYGRLALRSILPMLANLKESRLAIELHKKITFDIVRGWEDEIQNRRSNRQRETQNDFQFDFWYERQIAKFSLTLESEKAISTYRSIILAIEDYPDKVTRFMTALILEADSSQEDTSFWDIWQAFSNQFLESKWIDRLDRRRGSATRLLDILLLGIDWKENIRYWPQLNGQEYRVENFVKGIPASSASLKGYCRFLHWVGEKSLPNSFILVAEHLRAADPSQALRDSSTVYYLELLLRRYVYGQPLQLKKKLKVRKAVLLILDQLVDSGSSAAYQMRDDFVTPIPM